MDGNREALEVMLGEIDTAEICAIVTAYRARRGPIGLAAQLFISVLENELARRKAKS